MLSKSMYRVMNDLIQKKPTQLFAVWTSSYKKLNGINVNLQDARHT